MDNDDSALGGYVSSVEPFAPEKGKPSVDAADEKALVRLIGAVDKEIKKFHTIDGMKRFKDKERTFNADQREAMCNEMVIILRSFKQTAQKAIDDIKEAGK